MRIVINAAKKYGYIWMIAVLLLLVSQVSMAESSAAILTRDTQWRYLDRNMDPSPGFNRLGWTDPYYNDSAWNLGCGGFGAKNGSIARFTGEYPASTLLEQYDSNGNSQAAYFFRLNFYVENIEEVGSIRGSVSYDDAIIMYLNGQQVYDGCVPGGGYSQNMEYGTRSDGSIQTDEFILPVDSLCAGRNVLAVEVHQASSDVYFYLRELLLSEEPFVPEVLDTTGMVLEIGAQAGDIQISWMTEESGNHTLFLAAEEDILMDSFPPGCVKAALNETGENVYTAQIAGLFENTDYCYYVTDDYGIARSELYSFRMPDEEEYQFLFMGDPQIRSYEAEEDGAMWGATMDAALEQYPQSAFVVVAGDLGDVAKPSEYMAFRSPVSLKSIPVASNRGNHDAKAEYYEDQFSEPNADGCSYYFTYGDVLVVALDSNIYRYDDQKEFLRSAIEKENKKWVIVTMHHSIFSVGEHATGSIATTLRPEYSAIFKELDVDLVLSGHDHRYCRTYIMDGAVPTEKAEGMKQEGETLYISSGSASGNKYYDLAERADSFEYAAFYMKEKEPVYTMIQVSPEQLAIVTHGAEDGRIIDTCTLEKE